MKVILDYYDNIDRTKINSVIVNTKEISADNEIEIFEQFYKLNNNLRYCNGSYYKFQDNVWEEKYIDWRNSDDYKKKSFNLFYGKNGIVD